MKGMIRVSAAVLMVSVLAGGISEVAYARCGHHAQNTSATEYAACYQDGACLEDGSRQHEETGYDQNYEDGNTCSGCESH